NDASPEPRLILPVRNFESTGANLRPALGQIVVPPDLEQAGEAPIAIPGRLSYGVYASGHLSLAVSGTSVAEIDVTADPQGALSVGQVSGWAARIDPATRLVGFSVPPDPTITKVDATLTRAGVAPEKGSSLVATSIDDVGALPVGHTFVKGVS